MDRWQRILACIASTTRVGDKTKDSFIRQIYCREMLSMHLLFGI